MSASDLTKALTVKERAFCEAYCSNGGNATRAYFQAGYAASTESVASTESSKLLRKPEISDYVKYLQACVSKRFDISAERLVQELAAIAFTDPKDIFDDAGEMLPLSQIPEHARKSLQELTIESSEDSNGNLRTKRKAKLSDRQKALETLMKITGVSSDLNLALATLSKYGCNIKQDNSGEWVIEK